MTQYAQLADLYVHGAPQKAFGQLTTDQQNAALVSASEDVDTYLRGRYAMPIASWDTSITMATCRIAAYNLLSARGYNPGAGADVNVLDRYNQAIGWLVKVQKQQAHPNVTPAQITTPDFNQPTVITSSVVNLANGAIAVKRGW